MKAIKIIGVIIVIIAFVCGLGIVGRVETEDKQYRNGEITSEIMTTDEDLIKQIAICVGAAALGGVMWAVGAYVEADKIENKYTRYYRR